MTITQLRYLVELTESANATQAAQKLNVTRPALTNGIRQLEEQLNTKLVVTHNNKITLTANGQKVVAQAKKILNDVNTLYELVITMTGRLLYPFRTRRNYCGPSSNRPLILPLPWFLMTFPSIVCRSNLIQSLRII